VNNDKANTATTAELEELPVEDEEEEEEFTPSAWNAALAPHRSALRSPDKTLKSGVINTDKYIMQNLFFLYHTGINDVFFFFQLPLG